MRKVYSGIDGIKVILCFVCPPERKIIHSLKLVDYLHVQADKPWYNYFIVQISLLLLSCVKAFYFGLVLCNRSLSCVLSNLVIISLRDRRWLAAFLLRVVCLC